MLAVNEIYLLSSSFLESDILFAIIYVTKECTYNKNSNSCINVGYH